MQKSYDVDRVRLVHQENIKAITILVLNTGGGWETLASVHPDGKKNDVVLTNCSFHEQKTQYLKLEIMLRSASQ